MTVAQNSAAELVLVSAELVQSPNKVESLLASRRVPGIELHQQLLDRVSANAVALPAAGYSEIHVADVEGRSVTLDESTLELLFAALAPGGRLGGQLDLASASSSLPYLLTGFVEDSTSASKVFVKPGSTASQTVAAAIPLRKKAAGTSTLPKFKRLSNDAAVQIVTLDLGDDDDIIDENDLMADDAADLAPAIKFPAKCDPGPGRKRRKACKDCTCGLKELEEEELNSQQEKRRGALAEASVVKLSADDMAEVDFTVPGRAVGGCGSCALGDAFRCDGCPYLGLPPFKPGEVVSVVSLGGDL